MYILGFDIGGTKCAAVIAEWDEREVKLLKKEKCDTDLSISPENETFKIQELHLPIYHYLCAAVEKHFFGA